MREKLQQELSKLIQRADLRLLKILYATAKVYQDEESKMYEDDQLYRMVYISTRDPYCSEKAIEGILDASRRNNKPLGITGLLLHSDVRFLQILEGNKSSVNQIFEKIKGDPRHLDSEIRYFEPVKERYFENWHMGSKNISTDNLEFDTTISEKEKSIYKAMLQGERSSYTDKSMKELKTFVMLT